MPVLVIGLFASGAASMVESSAAACAFAIVTQCLVTRDLHVLRDLPRVLLKAATLIGAVLILLSSAMGLTSYLVDAQIPGQLLAAVRDHVHSPVVFLLVLNVFLLVLGSVLEIYSAIVILAPLVAPMGAAFGIDPIHLGVIFLANLELGFLFPPVGLNLFLSASRFGDAAAEAVPPRAAVPRHPRDRRAADHLRAEHDPRHPRARRPPVGEAGNRQQATVGARPRACSATSAGTPTAEARVAAKLSLQTCSASIAGSPAGGARRACLRDERRRAARPSARRARASGNDLPAARRSLPGRHDLYRRSSMQEAADR